MVATRRMQFSLRAMLLAFVIVSIPLCWLASERHEWAREHRIAASIEKRGGRVTWVWCGPTPWRTAFGESAFFTRITAIEFLDKKFHNGELSWLSELDYLASLTLGDCTLASENWSDVARVETLGDLWLYRTNISGSDLKTLGSLRRIQRLNLLETNINSADLAHIKSMPDLRDLNLFGTNVGDEGLAHLSGLPSLEQVNLCETQVTEAGLEAFMKRNPNVYVVWP